MNRPTPYDLLKECFDEIKHCDDPLKRKSILQAYAKHMEAREAEIAKEATLEAITAIMLTPTEGMFSEGDLFIKRAPIEQTVINLVGYETFSALRDAATAKEIEPADLAADKPETEK